MEDAALRPRPGLLRLIPWAVAGMAAAAVTAGLAKLGLGVVRPDFESLLFGGCTAGRLPGSPWAGVVVALVLATAVGGLSVSTARARIAAVLAATCGPLVYGTVEGWMSWVAILLQVAALLAFARERRRTSWILAVAAAWAWPPALLVIAAVGVGEFDRARHRGQKLVGALMTSLAPSTFALAGALPAWLLRRDSFLPMQDELGIEGVARLAAAWTRAWPDEVTARGAMHSGAGDVLVALQLTGLGLFLGMGLVRVLQRAGQHEGYAALRLVLGLGLWMLILGGWLGLGRGSWGSTQGLLHVGAVVLLAEGGVELAAQARLRRWVLAVVAGIGVGWAAGLYAVARQWVFTSPFLN